MCARAANDGGRGCGGQILDLVGASVRGLYGVSGVGEVTAKTAGYETEPIVSVEQ